ncbi:MAG TPA: hypothetical protein VGU23_09775, partial [Acidobacteriaceae bacterium]|nr:hypothetical protein [Acidobacteriaceae bacterium]
AHPSTLAAARQPYAAEARIASAALPSTSTADREHMLREALAINPLAADANRTRIDLFLIQPSTADPSASLAILHSLPNTMPTYPPAPSDPNAAADHNDATDTPSDPTAPVRGAAIDSPDEVTVPPASLPPGSADLDLATRIRLASQLATANQRDGYLEPAYGYAQLAVILAKDSPAPELVHRRDDLKTAVLLARRNSLRRPDLHSSLDQSIQVRPHLTASTVSQEGSQ